MPATLSEVLDLIKQAFPGSDVSRILEENHYQSGVMVWPGFKGKDSGERSRMFSERVRDKLGMRGINIGLIITLAPGEKP